MFFIECGKKKKCILAISDGAVLMLILYELFSSSHACSKQHQLLLLCSMYNRLAMPPRTIEKAD